jgi:DNA helicase-2/ATP-dependent DNA helicase PcrA
MNLNPSQREAVSTLKGPLLVLAGAGSGKTRVVTYRIAELIKHGVPPQKILAVTFTKKAAGEMQERAAGLLGRKLPERPEISTFHALCVKILRRHIRRLGYPEQFAIYDRGDQESLARGALREIKVPGEVLRPGDLIAIISRWKMAAVRPADAASVAQTDKEHLAAAAYRRYQNSLKAAGAVDFDDLLLLTVELFARFAEVRQLEAARFSHLMIDEYQDTNATQYEIIKALASPHRNLCVVGDDDQSIYGWRGAEVAHILRFTRDWPEAKVVRLEENYRSTAAILEMANRVIAFNANRHAKVLRAERQGGQPPRILQFPDEASEARQVIEEIRTAVARNEAQPRDFAILFRTNEQPRPFETELRRAKLPYVLIGGMSFYDRKEVRDILAYLKLLVQPRDEVSLLRIINTPPRGLGQATVAQLMDQTVQKGKPLWETLADAAQAGGLSKPALAGIAQLQGLVTHYREATACEEQSRGAADEARESTRSATISLVDAVRGLIKQIGYRQEIERLYKDAEEQNARWNAVEEVVNAIGSYEQRARRPSIAGFLEDVALGSRDDEDESETQLRRNCVALMTLHSAKGLEFPQVYLVGMEEGLLPHHRSVAMEETTRDAVDEERRLCYVGITRAQDKLTLTLALTRMKWGKPRPTMPSRFLYEMTGQAENRQTPRGVRRKATAVPRR